MPTKKSSPLKPWPDWKRRLYIIIFGTETPAGRTFDLILLISIVASVIIVFLDSVLRLHQFYGDFFYIAEWVFTILFSLEYILRIITSRKPFNYIFSFYGIIDLLAVIPTYLSLFVTGGHYLIVIRILRLLRIFRILKLNRYMGASNYLWASIINSRYKIGVFLWFVLTIIIIMGAVMYIIEGPKNGFTSIPESIYWAIVTLTTVGYGDISPHTAAGKVIASLIMIIGYSIIAVPTGIISSEMSKFRVQGLKDCERCGEEFNAEDARFCKRCGERL
jgi:voltage-gated potassium channel